MAVRASRLSKLALVGVALVCGSCLAPGGARVPAGPPATTVALATARYTLSPAESATETAILTLTAASPSASSTPTATPTLTVTPTPSPPATFLPYAAQRASPYAGGARRWGLQFMLEEDPARHAENVRLELPRARELGLSGVRTNIRWDHVEPVNTTPDQFRWEEYDRRLGDYSGQGFDLLVTLVAYPAWATVYQCGYGLQPGMEPEWRQFVRQAARRYSQNPYRVVAWEIGNEPDGKTTVNERDRQRPPEWGGGQPTVPYGGCWGDRAAQYKAFLQAAYEEIKAVDPEVLVTHGGLAYARYEDWFHLDFLEKLLEAGGGAYFDFFNYHWFPNVPDQPMGPEKHAALMALLDRYDQRKPVWLTETYRLTYADDPHGSQVWQIRFLTRELVEMLAFPELRRIYWYGWVDFPPGYREPGKPQRGLVGVDHTPKAALQVLPYLIQYTTGAPEDISTERVKAWRFRPPGGRQEYVIAWSRDGSPAVLELTAGTHGVPEARVVSFPEAMLLQGRCCQEYTVPPEDGRFRFQVGADSLFIALPAR